MENFKEDTTIILDPNLSSKTDQELVNEFQSGEPKPFFEIIKRYQSSVFETAYLLSSGIDSARALTKETFLKLYNQLSDSESAPSLEIKTFQSLMSVTSSEKEQEDPPTEDHQDVHNALNELPALQKSILILKYRQTQSNDTISEILELEEETTSTKIQKAKENFIDACKEREVNLSDQEEPKSILVQLSIPSISSSFQNQLQMTIQEEAMPDTQAIPSPEEYLETVPGAADQDFPTDTVEVPSPDHSASIAVRVLSILAGLAVALAITLPFLMG